MGFVNRFGLIASLDLHRNQEHPKGLSHLWTVEFTPPKKIHGGNSRQATATTMHAMLSHNQCGTGDFNKASHYPYSIADTRHACQWPVGGGGGPASGAPQSSAARQLGSSSSGAVEPSCNTGWP